jgi:hypothetical protein
MSLILYIALYSLTNLESLPLFSGNRLVRLLLRNAVSSNHSREGYRTCLQARLFLFEFGDAE